MADRWRRVKAKEVDEAVAERCRSFGITLPEVEFRVLDIAATKPFVLADLPLPIPAHVYDHGFTSALANLPLH